MDCDNGTDDTGFQAMSRVAFYLSAIEHLPPLNGSIYALSVGLPGREKSSVLPRV